jgi:hypothetical protein
MGVLTKVGTTGKGTHYVLAGKGLIKGSKGSSISKGSQRAQTAHREQPLEKSKPHASSRRTVTGVKKGPAKPSAKSKRSGS